MQKFDNYKLKNVWCRTLVEWNGHQELSESNMVIIAVTVEQE